MKSRMLIMMAAIMCIALVGCKDASDTSTWDCTVFCAEEATENSYIITYSEAEVVSKTGELRVENQNDFPIVVYLATVGEEDQSLSIEPGEVGYFEEVIKNSTYQIGLRADVAVNTEIKAQIYDGK